MVGPLYRTITHEYCLDSDPAKTDTLSCEGALASGAALHESVTPMLASCIFSTLHLRPVH